MTTATPAASSTAVEPLPEAIPDPAYVRSEFPNGVPLYIIRHEAAFDQIESQEGSPSIYFCLLAHGRDNGETNALKRVTWEEPAIFKRIARSAIGHGLIRVNSAANLDLTSMKESAYWSLPAIPIEMVTELENFFRAAHKKHGSEAIVMLTYDPAYADEENKEEGWGFLVPDQENNAGHCHYEWDSVMQEKPPHVDIVGSMHSHPGMSAFASHTDAEDQLDWDGLHITIGWMNSKNNGAAEWHIEYQLNNRRFEFKPSDVFEIEGDKLEWDDPKGYLDKIKKKSYAPKATGGLTTLSGRSTSPTTGAGGTSNRPTPSSAYSGFFRDKHNSARPTGCPDLVKNTVIAQLLADDDDDCPVCDEALGEFSIKSHRCTACFTYLLLPGEEPADIPKARAARYGGIPYVPGLEFLIDREGACPVVTWTRDPDPEKKATSKIIWQPESPGKALGDRLLSEDDRRSTSDDYIVCETCLIGLVPWLAMECPSCNFKFDMAYWEEKSELFGETLSDDVDPEYLDHLMKLPEEHLPLGTSLYNVYGDNRCLSCLRCGTVECDPLVEFIDAYWNLNDGSPLPEPREGICVSYVTISTKDTEDVN